MRTHEQIRQDLLAVETKLKRWRTKIKRAVNAADALERRKRHLEKLLTKPAVAKAEGYWAGIRSAPVDHQVFADKMVKEVEAKLPAKEPPPSMFNLQAAVEKLITGPSDDDLDVRRQPWAAERRRSPADQAAIDKAKSEKAERSRAKAKGQAETRKARRSGDTKRMPLSGKAAAAFIAGGK